MTALLYPFELIAALGFALSLAAHLAALTGTPIPGGSAVMMLHVGIFVVWLPAVIVANKASNGARRADFWKVVLSGAPEWQRKGLYALFAYAILNFVLFFARTVGEKPPPGTVSLGVVRGFSGHWMVFYAAAFVILHSARRTPALMSARLCPSGHAMAFGDRFCPVCGKEVPLPPAS